VRASTGPATLPDAPPPSPSSQDASGAVNQQQVQVEHGEPKSGGFTEAETTTVSYTEILGSWTPAQDERPDQPQVMSGAASNGADSGADAANQGPVDQAVDLLKTNVMPAVDETQADLQPTESLPTGSLPGSRPTSIFEAGDLPFEAGTAREATVPQGPIPSTGERAGKQEDWVVTARQVPEAQTTPVEPGTPIVTPPLVASTGESRAPLVPDTQVAAEGTPPASHSAPGDAAADLRGGAVPDTVPGAHSRQVPPEVAHYMAYMERQSGAPQPRAEAKQPERARKSRLVPVLLVTGFVGVVILVGIAIMIWKFREKQMANLTAIPSPPPTASIDTSQIAPPQTSPTVAVKEVVPEGMALIPAGTYVIGRDDGDHLAAPKHIVALAAFYIDKTEVTNAEYKRFVETTGHVSPDAWGGVDFPDGKGNYPVIGIRWQDAKDYSEWARKRLPSEAEWEAAARGSDGRLFPWGDRWENGVANVGTTGIVQVGSFPAGASPNGVLDMIGNVWEWTADELKLYPGNTGKLPESIESGIVYRVIRGGAFDSKQDASYRGFVDGSKGYPKTGFRCVKSAE
jgi:formylglycine-generating enzyme required for sulfatase activity